ncbi:MAG: DUF177 domain-containing protein [Actinomycetota bacterium]|nr:DUF177 domain-containing protein [Actinomycetota bacterium]MDQ6945177.1 DUF177 domain-containing protein [Actinomycetota bacterium]
MSPKPFLVNIAALRPSPGGRHHVVRTGRLGGLVVTSSTVPADAEVVVDAEIEVVDGGVVLTGTVAAAWEGECRRCLRPVTGELVAQVREVFERAPRLRPSDLNEADHADTYPLTGDTLDLTALARDALLLELPLAPLCRPDCVGLCPNCGTDLTERPCDCTDQPGHPVWAALEGLRILPGDDLGPESA